jgi:CxxC motif-containing protein
MEKEIVCISCPMGCRLKVSYPEDKSDLNSEDILITGNKCQRGIVYGTEEILAPKRVVTATCKILSKIQNRIPVKTDKPIEKKYIDLLLKKLYSLELNPPLYEGQKMLENFENSGVNVIITMSLEE